MADGGVSTYIMLISALLISSSASAVLIQEWSSTSRVIQQQQRGLQLSEELSIDFAGDPMNVNIDRTPSPDEITLYALNTGEHPMDTSEMEILIDGLIIPSSGVATTILGGGTDWNPNVLLQIELSNTTFNSYSDNDDISVFITASSESVSGMTGSASFGLEVRLNG